MITFLRIIRRSMIGIFVLFVILGILSVVYLESTLPSVEMLKDVRLQVPLRVYSSDNKLIAEFGEARRTPILLHQVPKDLINAVLATEDRRFYEHPGVDWRGLMRAGFNVMTSASVKQGGSTITMQVARNFFLTRKKTIVRKISEMLLALKIEKELTKDEILELYLNKIYFGKRAYGVAAAAEVYYGTTVDKLTLDQIAMIAGLPQAPSSINPLHDQDAAYKRRKHVLERMLSFGFITQTQFDDAVDAPLPTRYHGRAVELEAPYIAEMVRQDLYSRYGEAIYDMGYEVFTTVDSFHQNAANQALRRALLEYDQRHGFRKIKQHLKLSKNKTVEQEIKNWKEQLREIPVAGGLIPGVVTGYGNNNSVHVLLQDQRMIDIPWSGLSWAHRGSAKNTAQVGDVIYAQETPTHDWKMAQVPEVGGAFVSMEPDTGKILALVGGFDYNVSSYNRVTQAERQPGSNFKPFIYAAALDEGFTLASVISDSPLTYVDPVSGQSWSPKNASGRSYGPTRIRMALARSQNLVTVRLLQAVGIKRAIDFIELFGFPRNKLPPFMSLALGSASLTPMEMVRGYAAFPNGGYRITPNFIQKITDYQGNLIYEATPPEPVRIIRPQIAFLITSALQYAIQAGTGQRAKVLGRKDLAGKTGTTNDWMDAWYSGYNRDLVATAWVGFDDPHSIREYGSMAALPMWIYYMAVVLKDKPEHAPEEPEGIVAVQMGGYTEYFTEETAPYRGYRAGMPNDGTGDYGYSGGQGGYGGQGGGYGGYGQDQGGGGWGGHGGHGHAESLF